MRLRPVSGTVNSIIEHSPAGTDSDRQFLISPGLRPQPGFGWIEDRTKTGWRIPLCPSGQVFQRLADECLAGRLFSWAAAVCSSIAAPPTLSSIIDHATWTDSAQRRLLIPACHIRVIEGRMVWTCGEYQWGKQSRWATCRICLRWSGGCYALIFASASNEQSVCPLHLIVSRRSWASLAAWSLMSRVAWLIFTYVTPSLEINTGNFYAFPLFLIAEVCNIMVFVVLCG